MTKTPLRALQLSICIAAIRMGQKQKKNKKTFV